MSNKNSCINLGIIFPFNHIISFILRDFRMKQDCPIIEFRHFGFFLRFKSAKLGVSEMVYSFVFKPHSFPLSVIPKISTMFFNLTNENPFVESDKLPVTFYIESRTTIQSA